MSRIEAIAFDADDTLWHSESLFQATQKRLEQILDAYAPHDEVAAHLHETESKNIRLFGYGVKGFTLSMIETAIEMSKQRISAGDIHEIVLLGKAMLDNPLELMAGVEEVLEALGRDYPLYLITKGDMLDQQNKIDKSGLSSRFRQIEVVSEKDQATYRALFEDFGVQAGRTVMVGNSIPSDVAPVLSLGGYAVHIPYYVTASIEQHDDDPDHARFFRLKRITELPELIRSL
jgi:putative hydrolase of the HAD superfamily